MKEQIIDILREIAPLVAAFITSILTPSLIGKWSVNRLNRKIESIEPTETEKRLLKEIKELKKEVRETRDEVLMLRGKKR